jgi:CRISPR-associated exonuclease Cas4
VNEDMNIGKYVAKNHWLKTEKRKELYLVSDTLKMKSKIDYILKESGIQIPIEIKKGRWNRDEPRTNDKAQLICEILLLEQHLNKKIEFGYLLYVGSRHKYKIKIKPATRRWIKSIIREILSYIRSGKTPKIEYNEESCKRCSLREFCWCK